MFHDFVSYDFLHAMWHIFLAKVALTCSYYFIRLLLKVRLSCKSLSEFLVLCFHVLSHSRSSISVYPTNYRSHNPPEAEQQRQLNKALIWFLFLYYLATAFLHLATIFSLIVAKRRLGIFFNFEHCPMMIFFILLSSITILSQLCYKIFQSKDKYKVLNLVMEPTWENYIPNVTNLKIRVSKEHHNLEARTHGVFSYSPLASLSAFLETNYRHSSLQWKTCPRDFPSHLESVHKPIKHSSQQVHLNSNKGKIATQMNRSGFSQRVYSGLSYYIGLPLVKPKFKITL